MHAVSQYRLRIQLSPEHCSKTAILESERGHWGSRRSESYQSHHYTVNPPLSSRQKLLHISHSSHDLISRDTENLLFLQEGKLKLCHKLFHPEHFSLIGWMGMGEKNLSPHGNFLNPVVGRVLVSWKLRRVPKSASPRKGPNLDILKIWRTGKMLSLQAIGYQAILGLHKLKVLGWIWFGVQMDSGLKYYHQDLVCLFFFPFNLSYLPQPPFPHKGIGSIDLSHTQGPSPGHRSKSPNPSKNLRPSDRVTCSPPKLDSPGDGIKYTKATWKELEKEEFQAVAILRKNSEY